MIFVVFTLPAIIGGVRFALKAANAVGDHLDAIRGTRAEQARCKETTGEDPIHFVVELVTDKNTANALLRDARVVRGREAAQHFRGAGVL